eukprot:scaffold3274_cov244-Pinguiococcus_pyrenoidosus.AAC.3
MRAGANAFPSAEFQTTHLGLEWRFWRLVVLAARIHGMAAKRAQDPLDFASFSSVLRFFAGSPPGDGRLRRRSAACACLGAAGRHHGRGRDQRRFVGRLASGCAALGRGRSVDKSDELRRLAAWKRAGWDREHAILCRAELQRLSGGRRGRDGRCVEEKTMSSGGAGDPPIPKEEMLCGELVARRALLGGRIVKDSRIRGFNLGVGVGVK